MNCILFTDYQVALSRYNIDKTKLVGIYVYNTLEQHFSNFFQVGTTFISQNVLRTTLLLGLSNSLGLP